MRGACHTDGKGACCVLALCHDAVFPYCCCHPDSLMRSSCVEQLPSRLCVLLHASEEGKQSKTSGQRSLWRVFILQRPNHAHH